MSKVKLPAPINKVADFITKAFGVVGILIGVIVLLGNRNKVLDFFTDTFKISWIFYLFITFVFVFSISLSIKLKQQINDAGFTQSLALDIERLVIKRFNNGLKIFRILSGSFTGICFVFLLWSEYKTQQLGIYAGSFGTDIRFNEQVHAKVRDSGRITGFGYFSNSLMPYREEFQKQELLFHRYYDQGVLYSGQYDNTTKDSIINLEVKWIGGPFACPILSHFSGEFSKCTVDVNADATLISNFILGFANMHICNTSKALTYFGRVYSDIESTNNAHIRARMKPLKDSLDRYIKSMTELSQVSSKPKEMPNNTSSPNKEDEQTDSVVLEHFLALPKNSVINTDKLSTDNQSVESEISGEPDNIIFDNFSTMSVDSARSLITAIDMSGNLTLHQPGTKSDGIKFTLYPLHVYKYKEDYYVAYKLDPNDAWYSFVNLHTMVEERHSISPLTPGQIENYLRSRSQTTFKFLRPARIKYYNNLKSYSTEGKYSGVTVAIWSNIPKELLANKIKRFVVENANEGMISLSYDSLGLIKYYPCHILTNVDVIFIEKDYKKPLYFEYQGDDVDYLNRNRENLRRKPILDSIQTYINENYKQYHHIEFQKSPLFRIEKYTAGG
jgi:hypothetical protein